eukprot:SAG22_NODE_3408_length_1731_cov_1.291054_1_plen_163_part_10
MAEHGEEKTGLVLQDTAEDRKLPASSRKSGQGSVEKLDLADDVEKGSDVCLGTAGVFCLVTAIVGILIITGVLVDTFDVDDPLYASAVSCGSLTNRAKRQLETNNISYPKMWDAPCVYFGERHHPLIIGAITGAVAIFVSCLFAYQVLNQPEGFVAMKYVSNL